MWVEPIDPVDPSDPSGTIGEGASGHGVAGPSVLALHPSCRWPGRFA